MWSTKYKLLLAIIIVGILIYGNSLFNTFVWDDEEQVVNNVAVHSVANISTFFGGSTFNTGGSGSLGGMYYKPMMSVFFSVLYTVFGETPFFFHLFQMIIHIVNSILIFLIFEQFLERFFKKRNHLYPFIFIISLLFLIHPINVESVVYVSALQDVLCMFFGLLSLYILMKYEASSRFTILSLGLLLLSLFSKETGFVFIPICLSYLFLFKRKQLYEYGLFLFLMVIGYAFLRFGIAQVGLSKQGISPIMRVDLLVRLMTMPAIIFYYLKTFFLPLTLSIAQHWVVLVPTVNKFYIPLLSDILFFCLIIMFAIFLFKKKSEYFHYYIFFFIWFICGLGFHLQLFPLDMTVAERWFYIPSIGLLGMIVIILLQLTKYKNFFTFFIIISRLS